MQIDKRLVIIDENIKGIGEIRNFIIDIQKENIYLF